MTQLIRGTHNLPESWQDCVVAIGKFDGLHIGHQMVLAKLKAVASGLPTVVISFYPNPSSYFAEQPFQGLMTRRDQLKVLSDLKIDYLLLLPFNAETRALSPEQFLAILFETIKAKHVIVGQDFQYGKNRSGDIKLLSAVAKKYDVVVHDLDLLADIVTGELVKSSLIREYLQAGELSKAQKLLGRAYSISGCVVRGDQIGRQLGFKTANINLKQLDPALRGVFAVKVFEGDQFLYYGAANLGRRPTVCGLKLILEVHCLNCNADLYGKFLRVEFVEKIRDEEKFDSLQDLKNQIAKDVATVECGIESAPK